ACIGSRTADRYSRAQIDAAKNGVVDRSRRVVEECIDPVRTALCERVVNILRRLVVYGAVIAEILDTLSDLLGSAGEPDRAASLDLCDLPDGRANTAGRGRNRNGLSRLRPADIQQAEICSEPIEPQNP